MTEPKNFKVIPAGDDLMCRLTVDDGSIDGAIIAECFNEDDAGMIARRCNLFPVLMKLFEALGDLERDSVGEQWPELLRAWGEAKNAIEREQKGTTT